MSTLIILRASYVVTSILFPFGSNSFSNSENNSSMKLLLMPWIVFKVSNNDVVDNMLVDEPSYKGVDAFVSIASINVSSCCPWGLGILMLSCILQMQIVKWLCSSSHTCYNLSIVSKTSTTILWICSCGFNASRSGNPFVCGKFPISSSW